MSELNLSNNQDQELSSAAVTHSFLFVQSCRQIAICPVLNLVKLVALFCFVSSADSIAFGTADWLQSSYFYFISLLNGFTTTEYVEVEM